MPKTATGKVQRRQVAQSMMGGEAAVAPAMTSRPPVTQKATVVTLVSGATTEKRKVRFSKSIRVSLRQGLAKLLVRVRGKSQ